MQTTEGEQIAQLIAGYIDIILKKVSTANHDFPCSTFNFSPCQSLENKGPSF